MKTHDRPSLLRTAVVGLVAGFVSQGLMGVLFLNPWSQSLLSDPSQSPLYRQVTAARDVVLSVVGLILWGIAPAFLHRRSSLAGSPWRSGLVTGFWVWILFWVPQEWFMFVTLLGEPLPLATLELLFAAMGCVVQGLILGWGLRPRTVDRP